MALTTVRIIDTKGNPVTGVSVLVSDIYNQWVAVNDDGEVQFNADEGTALASLIAVKFGEGAIASGHLVIEAGETKTFTVL